MIDKWVEFIDLIFERNLISNSIWNIIHEVTHKNTKAKQQEEDRILKGIEDLIDYNNRITTSVNTLANSEYKILFMVATYRTERKDAEGKIVILDRRK